MTDQRPYRFECHSEGGHVLRGPTIVILADDSDDDSRQLLERLNDAFAAGFAKGLKAQPRRLERGSEVSARVSKSLQIIWRDIEAGAFPAPVEIGGKTLAWYADEVDAWLATRPRRLQKRPA